jgi:hypothetical protein
VVVIEGLTTLFILAATVRRACDRLPRSRHSYRDAAFVCRVGGILSSARACLQSGSRA